MTPSPDPSAPAAENPAPSSPAVTWTDATRAGQFDAWLQSLAGPHALDMASVRPASADASFRRYLRVNTTAGESRIIMDAPPSHENCAPFVQVAQLMHSAGLRAPEVLAWDPPQGFMLLPDLGTHTMMQLLGQGHTERTPLRDGKPQYLADTPRFVAYVRSTASRYRQLGPLMHLIEQIEGSAVQAGYTF